jgi:hypothetical protein
MNKDPILEEKDNSLLLGPSIKYSMVEYELRYCDYTAIWIDMAEGDKMR